jgi:hypothetical protein
MNEKPNTRLEGAVGDFDDLRSVPAGERVDRIRFSGLVEVTDRRIDVGTYRCAHCGTEAEFNTGTLRRGENVRVSPLGDEWQRRCEELRPVGAWEWALDFRCNGCRCPVRIVYAHDGEFSMGSWKHRLLEVLELGACGDAHKRAADV